VHALFRHAVLQRPDETAMIQRVLALPPKRFDRRLVSYLTEEEITAVLAALDRGTWTGRRDYASLMLACQTGLRASELLHLTMSDVHLGTGAHFSCRGKGRKQRITPLMNATVTTLRAWLAERAGLPTEPLFPTRRGEPLSRDGLQRRLTIYSVAAARTCPTLCGKHLSPHVLRHSAAMRLLAVGVDTTVIALWLGHEHVATTQIYVHADLALNEKALARTAPQHAEPGRYQPADTVLAFLDGL
jgi:integrase/recombinase XerD